MHLSSSTDVSHAPPNSPFSITSPKYLVRTSDREDPLYAVFYIPLSLRPSKDQSIFLSTVSSNTIGLFSSTNVTNKLISSHLRKIKAYQCLDVKCITPFILVISKDTLNLPHV
jgi:hypothetical protein